MIGVACHRGMVDDSSAARAILNPISSPYAPGSSLPLRLQPARRTLAALVFPSRVLSTSKVSRSPFLMLSGSMPDDCSALICRNHRVAHRHLFIEGLLISVGDLLPSARGETKFPEAVFTAAHHGCEGLRLDNQDALVDSDDEVDLPRFEIYVSDNNAGNSLRRQEFDGARKGGPLGSMLNGSANINSNGGQLRLRQMQKGAFNPR